MTIYSLRDEAFTDLKGITFDLDDTLIDREATVICTLEKQFDTHKIDRYGILLEEYVEGFMRHNRSGLTPRVKTFEILTLELNIPEQLHHALVTTFTPIFCESIQIVDGSFELLDYAVERNYKLAVITNGKGSFPMHKLRAAGMEQYFSHVINPDVCGARKPDVEIFEHTLAHLRLDPHQVLHVGDHPVADYEGALKAGLHAVLLETEIFEVPLGIWSVGNLHHILALLSESPTTV